MDNCLVGVIRVPVSNLCFRQDLGARQFDELISEHLKRVIHHDDQHEDKKNHVSGIVDYAKFSLILQELQLSEEQMIETIWNTKDRPLLQTQIVEYGDGQHRIEAAKAAFGEDTLWTVSLYRFVETDLQALAHVGFTKQKTDHFSHETRHSDGEIFLRIQHFHSMKDLREERRWRLLLKEGKNIAVDMILARTDICNALINLREFSGLWAGMQLGNYHRHFALHCDRELLHYLRRIYEGWDHLLLGYAHMRAYVDIATVRAFEGRAPGVCESDRQYIQAAFESKKVFSSLKDRNKRLEISQHVLQYKGSILSLRSLHEHLKYFSISVRIIRELILPHEFTVRKNGRLSNQRRRKSVGKDLLLPFDQSLRQCWDENHQPLVEVSEGNFKPVKGPAAFELSYIQLILVVLRSFPYLSNRYSPRIDPGDEIVAATVPDYVSIFHQKAMLLGFRGAQLKENSSINIAPMLVEQDSTSAGAMLGSVERRWGRPHSRTFRTIQQVGFLPDLLNCPESITVQFVLRELLKSFLKVDVDPLLDWSAASVPKGCQTLLTIVEVPEGDVASQNREVSDAHMTGTEIENHTNIASGHDELMSDSSARTQNALETVSVSAISMPPPMLDRNLHDLAYRDQYIREWAGRSNIWDNHRMENWDLAITQQQADPISVRSSAFEDLLPSGVESTSISQISMPRSTYSQELAARDDSVNGQRSTRESEMIDRHAAASRDAYTRVPRHLTTSANHSSFAPDSSVRYERDAPSFLSGSGYSTSMFAFPDPGHHLSSSRNTSAWPREDAPRASQAFRSIASSMYSPERGSSRIGRPRTPVDRAWMTPTPHRTSWDSEMWKQKSLRSDTQSNASNVPDSGIQWSDINLTPRERMSPNQVSWISFPQSERSRYESF